MYKGERQYFTNWWMLTQGEIEKFSEADCRC
jgi:hypothetical protein